MGRKLRVRDNPTSSFIGGVVAIVMMCFGAANMQDMGGFGVLWIFGTLAAALASFYNAFSDRGIAKEIIEVDDDRSVAAPRKSAASRLTQLMELKEQGLITAAEYEQRRAVIVREL
jgi:hypothetical protein